MAGMGRDSGTRSGLLWEVERLLKECDELPQVLVMENVIQVHSEGENRKNFLEWIRFLESIGYTSSWKDMNARHYGTPQNRNRCICVSILGNYKKFEFPKPFPLKVMATDLLEDEVDDKYYIRNDKSKILLDKLEDKGIILTDVPRQERKCRFCDNLLGKKGSLGMCNKHYIQYKRWGDPLHSDKKERATIDGYYRDGKTGRREHRIIWENHYNEKLSDEEIIHHINFVKTDNRIENLYKYSNASEHISAHREYERIIDKNPDAYIEFVDGRYVERERERERAIRQTAR